MKTILIVDDNIENLYLLRVILEKNGYLVVDAKDGKEGLSKLHHTKVDLIISDILMPIMDGYMFCQACKKEKDLKKIPFVFYTSTYTEKPDEEFALKLGAAKFIKKPIDHEALLFIVEDIFDKITSKKAYVRRARINDEEVLKLYSERLINKLEEKTLELKNEIVERKKAEQVLTHENQIMDLITENTKLDKILDHILINFESMHSDYFGSINVMQPDGIHLELMSAPSLPKGYRKAVKRVRIGEQVGSCGTAAFIKKPVIVSDIDIDPRWSNYKDIALKHHLKSCWSIPILSKSNEVLGTFAIYSNRVKMPSLDEINTLSFSVNLANIAIEKYNIAQEVKKIDESYQSLIEQASDAIITYSFDGTIHDFNKSACESLGYTSEEFKKLKTRDFVVGGLTEMPKSVEKMKSGDSLFIYRQLIRKDGSLIEAEISAKLQSDGKILGIARDITERKKAEVTLKEKNIELIKSNEELDRFVYSASHDLRAPLTSLRGLINISESGLYAEQDELKAHLKMMSQTIDKMDTFIEDILDYSRNTRTLVKNVKIDFDELIHFSCNNLKFMNVKLKHKTFVEVNQQVDFYSDKKRLEIILNNIISNAFKYYDENKKEHFIHISVNTDSEKAVIEIADNGVGIAKKHLNKIFDMFYRATKYSKGSGMGMYIVKETVDKLRGTINVESEINKETKFTIILPNTK
ncbi:hypothetical protein APS56_01045 [Pseudalgibacter alginicilyticus]|uniref:histidine kinase n=1 Tax=Pseudalgibacter alginicilyticus TaxID=1736674 RepID=A0A0P0D7R1_9FLAO|nr:ATP-binding protein [Pseudalgibacter alginicilyticus]ALJ03820.1 hypothetical protein APS56_01045 [Pseudalgibacter alginicilyticus]